MTAFVRDVLGLQPGHRDDGWAVFQLESGDRDLVEVYRPGGYDERLLPALATGPTVAFAVDDSARRPGRTRCAGIEIVADIVWAAEAFDDPRLEGLGWLFFRAPDGNIYALQQDQRRRTRRTEAALDRADTSSTASATSRSSPTSITASRPSPTGCSS